MGGVRCPQDFCILCVMNPLSIIKNFDVLENIRLSFATRCDFLTTLINSPGTLFAIDRIPGDLTVNHSKTTKSNLIQKPKSNDIR